MKIGVTARVKITGEKVLPIEEVKFITKQKYVDGPEGSSPLSINVKVPPDQPTWRCRRFIEASGNSQSRYEMIDFTALELEQQD